MDDTLAIMPGYGEDDILLHLGFPSNHFTACAGEMLGTAAQALATTPAVTSGNALLYGPEQGSKAYREELAKFLSADYGEPVSSDSLHLTAGATHGLHFVASQTLRSGDFVFMEDPTYFLGIKILRDDLGMNVVPVPTDREGIDLDVLEKLLIEYRPKAREPTTEVPYWGMLYTMPVFNNPKGGCLPEERCKRLVELSRQHGLLVFCDDVYNLLHYEEEGAGPPRRLLSYEKQMHDDDYGNIISNGSFSKILAPAIRVGWIETSKKIMNILQKSSIPLSGGAFNHYGSQLVAQLLKTGMQQKIVQDMRIEHIARQKAVNAVLREKLPAEVIYDIPRGGYFYWLELPQSVDMEKVVKIAKEKSVSFIQGKRFSPSGSYGNCLRFSISRYREKELTKGVRILCDTIKECMKT